MILTCGELSRFRIIIKKYTSVHKMAVFVDISDTLHLAYSPLNEKHNVLYNRARQIFNQRFIQKPWFNLSPFLDKATGSSSRAELENFVPDDFKGVQPLQSLCIVEDYFNDRPLSMKEFKIGEKCLVSYHLISSHLIASHLTSPHLTSPHLISPSPLLTSPHLISSHHLAGSGFPD